MIIIHPTYLLPLMFLSLFLFFIDIQSHISFKYTHSAVDHKGGKDKVYCTQKSYDVTRQTPIAVTAIQG